MLRNSDQFIEKPCKKDTNIHIYAHACNVSRKVLQRVCGLGNSVQSRKNAAKSRRQSSVPGDERHHLLSSLPFPA